MIVRSEDRADIPAIDRVHRLAFGQPDEAAIVDRLRTSEAFIPGLSLVADDGGSIIGHILFTRVSVDPSSDVRVISLAPMAVVPERQREGVGSELVRHGLDAAARMGEEAVVVVGHPAYYPRFGFEPASEHGLRCPFPVPNDAFLVLRLRDGVVIPAGVLVYPPELGGA